MGSETGNYDRYTDQLTDQPTNVPSFTFNKQNSILCFNVLLPLNKCKWKMFYLSRIDKVGICASVGQEIS